MTARTLGELREQGYRPRSVKDELRANLIARLAGGDPLFDGIVGYGESVLPALERGILAGHDLILLGERGQAKTRIIRRLTDLLDPLVPAIEGCEVNDDPFAPICRRCREMAASEQDDLPLVWLEPDQRFAEKLATPDISVGDLIGDIDPIRVAEGRYLSDELTIHYGLVPRSHRGIFSINELPDLPERIQVALLNILEERDVQIRGYRIRLPLDLMLVATANPEDYTHRGRIITPLKDRFGTQVRTHYPETIDQEVEIMRAEARVASDTRATVPAFLEEVIAGLTHELRYSPQVNQRSGVSVRFSIGNLETVLASAERRALMAGESRAVARPIDIWNALEASAGRVEFESLEEGREDAILSNALKRAIADVFRRRCAGEDLTALRAKFDEGLSVSTSDDLGAESFLAQFDSIPGLGSVMQRLDCPEESPQMAASALEFVLEGMHLTKRINKSADARGFRYEA